jgi:alkylhydroperoxidase/carboxymuconolactone decarboxylase family protein YurZ
MRIKTIVHIISMMLLVICTTYGCGNKEAMDGNDESEIETHVKAALDSPAFKQAMEQRQALMEEEEDVKEEAVWFGTTGLSDEIERELPRYLRRELGESIFDEGALQASDLVYLGSFVEQGKHIHYWHFNQQGGSDIHYAYVEIFEDGNSVIGWGDRQPPR